MVYVLILGRYCYGHMLGLCWSFWNIRSMTHTIKEEDDECASNETAEQPAEVRICQESSVDFKMLCEFLEDSVPQFAYITVPSIGLDCKPFYQVG